jgi:copper(I)-binding protein
MAHRKIREHGMRLFFAASLLTALSFAGAAWAAGDLTVDHGAVPQTKKIGETAPGFLTIHNNADSADVLTAWNCPIADTTDLVGGNGQALQSLTIPAGQTVTLGANGPHLMLRNIHDTINYGSVVPCALTFQQAGDVAVYLNASE